ncbi:hypothetical protein, partial [Pseudomonas sp. SDO55104_S430]
MAKVLDFEEYIEWLRIKPRTNDWGALVAYEQKKCNELLLQNYVERFDDNSYMDPFNGTYLIGENFWQAVIKYVQDSPRI